MSSPSLGQDMQRNLLKVQLLGEEEEELGWEAAAPQGGSAPDAAGTERRPAWLRALAASAEQWLSALPKEVQVGFSFIHSFVLFFLQYLLLSPATSRPHNPLNNPLWQIMASQSGRCDPCGAGEEPRCISGSSVQLRPLAPPQLPQRQTARRDI